MIQTIGLIAAVVLPLWNIPLIMRIVRRKSSRDISLFWALGVWICLLAMFPSGLISHEIIWKTFTIVNLILFTAVVVVAFIYHKPKS